MNDIQYERCKKDHNYFEYDIKSIYIYDTTQNQLIIIKWMN